MKPLQDAVSGIQKVMKTAWSSLGDFDELTKKSALATKRLSNTVQEQIKDQTKTVASINAQLRDYRDALMEHEHFTDKHQRKMAKLLEESIKNQKHVNEASFKSAKEMSDFMDHMGDVNDAMKKHDATFQKNVADANGNAKKLQKASMEYQKAVRDHLNARVKTDGNQYAKAFKAELDKRLGINAHGKPNANLKAAETGEIMQQLMQEQRKVFDEFHENLGDVSTRAHFVGKAFSGLNKITGGMVEKLTTYTGLVSMLVEGLKGAYNDFRSIGSAGLAGDFFKINSASMKLAISFEEVVKKLQEAGQVAVKMGTSNYLDALGHNKSANYQLGLNGQDTVNLNAMAISMATAYGADVKNRKILNRAMNDNISEFTRLRAITGENADQFIEHKKQLLESNEFQERAAALNLKQRGALEKTIMLQYTNARIMGLTNEQAKQALELSQQQSRSRLKSRAKGGAQIAALASMVGMGSGGMRANELLMKRNRSSDEENELRQFMGQLNKKVSAGQFSDNYGLQELFDSSLENLDASVKPMLTEVGKNVNLAEPKKVNAADIKAREEEGKVSPAVAKTNETLDTIKTLLDNNLAKIAYSAMGILALLVARNGKELLSMGGSIIKGGAKMIGKGGGLAVKAKNAVGKLFGSGAAEEAEVAVAKKMGIGSKLAGLGKAGASVIGKTGVGLGKGLLKHAGVIGTVAGIGLSAKELYDIRNDSKLNAHDKNKKTAGLAGNIAGAAGGAWAGTTAGAAIGTMILPGVGTVIGGALGATIAGLAGSSIGESLGSGAYNMFSGGSNGVKPNNPKNINNITAGKKAKPVTPQPVGRWANIPQAPAHATPAHVAAKKSASDSVAEKQQKKPKDKMDVLIEQQDKVITLLSQLVDNSVLHLDAAKDMMKTGKLASLGVNKHRNASTVLTTALS